MIAINDIRQIARQMQNSGLGKIEINGKDFSLRLRCEGKDFSDIQNQPRSQTPFTVKAAVKGRFWASHPMQEKSALARGAQVKAGDCLGFLQTGDLMTPIRSPQEGEIRVLNVANGEQVGRGRVLFTLQPAAQTVRHEEAEHALY